ncbi:MAG: ABC transporter permease, partial [Blastocatellia bacterium]
MDQLKNDLIHSLRIIARSPGFAAVAILALAMGIGANSALFSVVNAVLLRPLPYGNPDRLVVITEKNPQTPSMSVAYPDFLDYTNKSRSFERLAAYRWAGGDLTGVEVPERLDNYQVSAGYFEILGATPIHGRTFLPDEDRPGAAPAIVLGNDVWQRQFGSDPNVVGRSVVINGLSYSVVGVMPASFRYPAAAQSWTTIGRVGNLLTDRGVHQGLTVLGLLKAGVGVDQARAEISTIADNLAREYKATNEGVGVNVGLLREQIIGGVRVLLMVLLGAVGFVLLIACANVANLLLARSASRQKEIAMRVALGAGRTRIVRQLLTESVLMSLIGGALGVAVAYWAIRFVKATNPANGNIPRLQEVNIDGRVLLVTLVISLLTGVIFGLAPALQSSRPDLNETLKEGGRGSDGGAGGSTTRKLLVVAEVALALVVSIGGGLMIKGFVHLMRTDAGFNPDGVVVMSLALPASRYPDADKQTSLYKGLLNRVSSLPGVQSVGLVNPLPLYEQGNQSSSMQEGVPFRRENIVRSDFLTVSPDYFAAMG